MADLETVPTIYGAFVVCADCRETCGAFQGSDEPGPDPEEVTPPAPDPDELRRLDLWDVSMTLHCGALFMMAPPAPE